MLTEETKELIKKEFIDLLRRENNFHYLNRSQQIQAASDILEQVFEKTKIYFSRNEKKMILEEFLENVVFGLRQLQKYQDDPDIEEIMINGYQSVFIKKRRSDGYKQLDLKFEREELWKIIEKLLEGTGRRVDRSNPLVDLRLADGSRGNIIVEPLSHQGPVVTIRKFPEKTISLDDLVKNHFLSEEMKDFLQETVRAKFNVVISGGTASGKTTTLTALTDFIKGGEQGDRIIVIEETSEIRLPDKIINKVCLEVRPPNVEGKGEYTIRDLLRNALRMRPDRIIVGEVRGGEAFDMLQAMNTGHPGSFTTIHANSTKDAVNRLEALMMLAGFHQLPLKTIRKWITSSLDLIIQIQRLGQNERKIMALSTFDQKGQIKPIFSYDGKKFVKDASLLKQVKATINKRKEIFS